jgi:hypothetical protein
MSDETVPLFKKKTRPVGLLRKRKTEEEDESKETEEDDDNPMSKTIDELKEMQRLKKKVNRGINVEQLMESTPLETSRKEKKEKSGLTDLRTLSSELDLGNTFSKETNRRDEDAEMAKFIEEELAKRKGLVNELDSDKNNMAVGSSVEDLVFNVLPQHLLAPQGSQKTEEMLSNQMLSGIPEVDLGVEEKIRTIEATEEAKKKLLMDRLRRSNIDHTQTLIPTNIAVNFNQVNRAKVQDLKNKTQELQKVATAVVEEPVVCIGQEPAIATFTEPSSSRERQLKHPGNARASDDYHFERFRKQFRK